MSNERAGASEPPPLELIIGADDAFACVDDTCLPADAPRATAAALPTTAPRLGAIDPTGAPPLDAPLENRT
jgi:hypothetical protein